MLISIITATYNSETNIASALQSIAMQDHPNVELLIIDGQSRDRTLEVVKETYTGKVTILSEKDKGIYDALNKGISMASGDVIGFVHSDDLLSSSDIVSKISSILSKEGIDGVYGDLEYVQKKNTNKVLRYWKSKAFHPKLLSTGWMPAHPTLFLKKSVYKKHGSFNLNYRIAADYDFILRIFNDPDLTFHYLPEVVCRMRIGGASNKSVKNILHKSKEDFLALKANNINNPYKALFFKNITKINQFIQ